MKQFIDQILQSSTVTAFPIMTHPGIEALGYTVKDAVTNGQIHFEAIKYISENFNTNVCTSIMDLTVEAEAFGAEVNFSEDKIPSVTGRLVWDAETVDALKVPTLDKGRISQYLLANKLAIDHIKDKPVFSGCIGPFSLAGRLFDMSEIMVGIYIDPETILNLLSKCTEFLLNYCQALKDVGSHGVIIAEPAAGLLSNDDCNLYSTDFVKKIVEAVQDDNFTVILHNCGNYGHCTQAMIASGAKALHFGNAINMVEVLKECPEDIIVMGNLDPVGVFKQGSVDSVKLETESLLSKTSGYKNFVISSGCDLPPHVPEENIRIFLETIMNTTPKGE
ncbi:MAG: uroporphyrinogen decarboxylase family protein [Paludibacter sp.]|nr:uroporphyrinogen decarboxylase family protein [Paludibacter sp.]